MAMSITEYYQKLEQYQKQRDEYKANGDINSYLECCAFLNNFVKYKEELMLPEDERLSILIGYLKEDVRDRFEYKTLMFNALSDMLDNVVTDLNDMIKEFTKYEELSVTRKIKRIKKDASDIIKILDNNCNDSTSEDLGNFSDELLPYIEKKAQERCAWNQMMNNNVKYAKEDL